MACDRRQAGRATLPDEPKSSHRTASCEAASYALQATAMTRAPFASGLPSGQEYCHTLNRIRLMSRLGCNGR